MAVSTYTVTMEINVTVLQGMGIELLQDLAKLLLGIYPNASSYHKDTYLAMFIVAVLIPSGN